MDQIGKCKGCNQPSRLDDGVCYSCLSHPKRGRKWAEMSNRCRTDPSFSLSVYCRIRTARGREIYEEFFGLPPGAGRITRPKLMLVQ